MEEEEEEKNTHRDEGVRGVANKARNVTSQTGITQDAGKNLGAWVLT